MKRAGFLVPVFVILLIMLPVSTFAEDSIIGVVETVLQSMTPPDATVAQTSLGSVAADAARHCAGTDLAILNGGDFYSNLQPGPVTREDVRAVFRTDKRLAVSGVTYAVLLNLLEFSVSRLVLNENDTIDYENSSNDAFPQVSGFSFVCDVSAPPGSRVLSIRDKSGASLDPDGSYTLAATEFFLSGGFGNEAVDFMPAGLCLSDALCGYIVDMGSVNEDTSTRIEIYGSLDNSIAGSVSPAIFIILLAAMVLFAVSSTVRKKEVSGQNAH